MSKGRPIRLSREEVLDIIAKNPKRKDQLAAAGYSSQGWYNIVSHYGILKDKSEKTQPILELDIGLPAPAAKPIEKRVRTVKNEISQEYFTKAFEASGRIISRTSKTLMMNVNVCKRLVEKYGLVPVDGRFLERKPKTVVNDEGVKEQVSTLKPHQKARLEIAWAGLAESIEEFFGNDDYV